MKKLVLFALMVGAVLIFATPASSVTVYKWIDSRGITNFTDDPNNVPSGYQGQVEKKEVEEATKQEVYSIPQRAPQRKGDTLSDIYGRDESWWRGKVRPWKEQLREASENYEKVNQRFTEEAEVLTQFKYGSRTQVKSKIIEMDRTNDERTKYEGQMTEAMEMLNKLAAEAEESRANPDWLK